MEIQPDIASMLLDRIREVPEWMERGSCAHADLDPMFQQDEAAFLAMCQSCPVRPRCEQYFLTKHTTVRRLAFGVGGGINFAEYLPEEVAVQRDEEE